MPIPKKPVDVNAPKFKLVDKHIKSLEARLKSVEKLIIKASTRAVKAGKKPKAKAKAA